MALNKTRLKATLKHAEADDTEAQFLLGAHYDLLASRALADVEAGAALPAAAKANAGKALMWYTRAAERGHVPAMNNLGVVYLGERGVPRSDALAFRWFSAAALVGNADGLYNLALLYEHGKGCTKNIGEAIRCYRAAAEKGLVAAMHPLAWFLHAEMPDDPVALCEARQWLTKAADSGDVAAMCDLGWAYHEGVLFPRQRDLARRYSALACAAGSIPALCNLALIEEEEDNAGEALKLYEKAAKLGNADALLAKGRLLASPEPLEGVPRDVVLGELNTREGLRVGGAEVAEAATVQLVDILETQRGDPKSLKEAADILEAYCSPQSPYPRSGEILYRLSRVYRRGLGRPEDAKLEIKFLREAAVEGYAKAQRVYGDLLLNACEDDDQLSLAISLLQDAADEDGRAAYLLSNIYQMGVGVERSRDRALRFLTLAAKAKYPLSCTALAITLEESGNGPANEQKVVSLLTSAARRGDVEAMFRLYKKMRHDPAFGCPSRLSFRYLVHAARKAHPGAMLALAKELREGWLSSAEWSADELIQRAASAGDVAALALLPFPPSAHAASKIVENADIPRVASSSPSCSLLGPEVEAAAAAAAVGDKRKRTD